MSVSDTGTHENIEQIMFSTPDQETEKNIILRMIYIFERVSQSCSCGLR